VVAADRSEIAAPKRSSVVDPPGFSVSLSLSSPWLSELVPKDPVEAEPGVWGGPGERSVAGRDVL
jgi:hypothetical protein